MHRQSKIPHCHAFHTPANAFQPLVQSISRTSWGCSSLCKISQFLPHAPRRCHTKPHCKRSLDHRRARRFARRKQGLVGTGCWTQGPRVCSRLREPAEPELTRSVPCLCFFCSVDGSFDPRVMLTAARRHRNSRRQSLGIPACPGRRRGGAGAKRYEPTLCVLSLARASATVTPVGESSPAAGSAPRVCGRRGGPSPHPPARLLVPSYPPPAYFWSEAFFFLGAPEPDPSPQQLVAC